MIVAVVAVAVAVVVAAVVAVVAVVVVVPLSVAVVANLKFLIDFWRQRAFRKLAKWQFGGLVVDLMPRRLQLAGHVGFNMGLRVHI